MKKQSIILSTLLILTTGLYATTANDLIKSLEFNYQNTFNKSSLFQDRLNSLQWNGTIEEVEAFVSDKSKNLLGSKDAALTSIMTELKNINSQLINNINEIQKVYSSNNKATLQGLLTPVRELMERIDDIRIKLNQMSFTLTNKKEALDLLVNTASYIAKVDTQIRLNLLAQINKL